MKMHLGTHSLNSPGWPLRRESHPNDPEYGSFDSPFNPGFPKLRRIAGGHCPPKEQITVRRRSSMFKVELLNGRNACSLLAFAYLALTPILALAQVPGQAADPAEFFETRIRPLLA